MRFRHSIRVTVDNFRSVFSNLLYRVVTGVIFFSIMYVILRLSLSFIVDSVQVQTLKQLISDLVKSVLSGNIEFLASFQDSFNDAVLDLGRLIASGGGAIAGAVIGVSLIYIVSRIVDGLATFAMGTIVNDRMSLFARTPFSTAFFKSVGKGILYELVYVPLSFVYDVLSLLVCWFVFFYLRAFISVTFLATALSLAFFIAAFLCLEALKMTVISGWMPAMIRGKKKVGEALKYSLNNRRGFGARFSCMFTSVYIVVVTNFMFCLCTFGSGLILTVPLSFLFMLSVQFVFYYHDAGKKYFIGVGEIVDPEQTQTQNMYEKESNI